MALDGRPRAGDARAPGGRRRGLRLRQQPARPGAGGRRRRTRSTSRASCRPTSGRCSARARARSAGSRCRATRRTSRRTDRGGPRALPRRRRRCGAGSRWPRSRCRSRGCRRASAGSATASARRPGSRSTSSSRTGEVKAPIVIGRDHLDSGSVASPNRETEAMSDGSDAIADWPLLNALVNTAAGRDLGVVHHGGGVGIGYSQHAGMVVVADGTRAAAQARARAHDRSGHGRRPPRRRGLRAGDRGRPRARRPHPDARRVTRRATLVLAAAILAAGCRAAGGTPSTSPVTPVTPQAARSRQRPPTPEPSRPSEPTASARGRGLPLQYALPNGLAARSRRPPSALSSTPRSRSAARPGTSGRVDVGPRRGRPRPRRGRPRRSVRGPERHGVGDPMVLDPPASLDAGAAAAIASVPGSFPDRHEPVRSLPIGDALPRPRRRSRRARRGAASRRSTSFHAAPGRPPALARWCRCPAVTPGVGALMDDIAESLAMPAGASRPAFSAQALHDLRRLMTRMSAPRRGRRSARQSRAARRLGPGRAPTGRPRRRRPGRASSRCAGPRQSEPGGTRSARRSRRARSSRGPRHVASVPPRIAPIGIVPHTMNRIVAFIRPCIRGGVIAWRRLTWLML